MVVNGHRVGKNGELNSSNHLENRGDATGELEYASGILRDATDGLVYASGIQGDATGEVVYASGKQGDPQLITEYGSATV